MTRSKKNWEGNKVEELSRQIWKQINKENTKIINKAKE